MASTKAPASLENQPLELLHVISEYLDQHNVGSLRLVSKSLSGINVSYMLHTLPIQLSYNSFARALALSQSALSQHVRALIITTRSYDQPRRASLFEIEAIDAWHRVMAKSLGGKYAADASLKQHRITLREVTYHSWEDTDFIPFDDREHFLGHQGASYSFLDAYMVKKALTALFGQFQNLERICLDDVSCRIERHFPDGLVFEPSPITRSPVVTLTPSSYERLSQNLVMWFHTERLTSRLSNVASLEYRKLSYDTTLYRSPDEVQTVLSKVKRLSYIVSQVSVEDENMRHHSLCRHSGITYASERAFLYFHRRGMKGLEELELKFPQGGYVS